MQVEISTGQLSTGAAIYSSECCRRFVILRSKVEKTSFYAPAARVLELLFRGSPSKVWTSATLVCSLCIPHAHEIHQVFKERKEWQRSKLSQTETGKRCPSCTATLVRHNNQFKRRHCGEFDSVVFYLSY